jgi:predicted O-methyltransferase YrrM
MRFLKNFVLRLCQQNKFIRQITFSIVSILGLKSYKERLMKLEAEARFFKSINYIDQVMRGPFKGMKYTNLESFGSDLAPKIIGSYEEELNEIIEDIISSGKYTNIVDIGCAEGYYAVGLALRMKNVKIHAFDAEEKALELCKAMAATNNVTNSILLNGFCNPDTLKNFQFKGKGLIICDCEGYEYHLFTKETIPYLKECDLIIELHDQLDDRVSKTILPLFKESHNIKLINSFIRNPGLYSELKDFSPIDQKLILSETRDGVLGTKPMQWAYITSKK